MTRPVIGITAYREQARWGAWETDAVLVPDAYVGRGRERRRPGRAASAGVRDLGRAARPARRAASRRWRRRRPRPVRRRRCAGDGAVFARTAIDSELALARRRRSVATSRRWASAEACRSWWSQQADGCFSTYPTSSVTRAIARPLGPTASTPSTSLRAVGWRTSSATEWSSAPRTTRASRTAARCSCPATPTTGSSRESRTRPERFALGVLWHPEVRDDARLFEALVDAAARPS